MLLEVLLICSLVQSAPFYDCEEQWEIRIYDSPPNLQCGILSQNWISLGCQKYETRNIDKMNFSYGEKLHYDIKTIHIYPLPNTKDVCGNNILHHEIMHAQGISHSHMAKNFDCPEVMAYDYYKIRNSWKGLTV